MSVTLTTNYKETLELRTVEFIDELIDQDYDLSAMLEFIDENSEEEFVGYYEEYVRCGEAIGYEAVDALIAQVDCSAIENCDERYCGSYESEADFAEECFDNECLEVPAWVVIDWQACWDRNLYYDHTSCYAGYRNYHIFSDH